MTREEAIRELRQDKELYETDNCHAGDGSPDGDLLEALNMAIEALEREDTMLKEIERILLYGERREEWITQQSARRTVHND